MLAAQVLWFNQSLVFPHCLHYLTLLSASSSSSTTGHMTGMALKEWISYLHLKNVNSLKKNGICQSLSTCMSVRMHGRSASLLLPTGTYAHSYIHPILSNQYLFFAPPLHVNALRLLQIATLPSADKESPSLWHHFQTVFAGTVRQRSGWSSVGRKGWDVRDLRV